MVLERAGRGGAAAHGGSGGGVRRTPDIAADRNKRANNGEFFQRVAEIGDFLDARALYVGTLPP